MPRRWSRWDILCDSVFCCAFKQEIPSRSQFRWWPRRFTASACSRATQNLAEWARLRPSLACYIPDEANAENAAALQRSLRRQGRQLETVDAFIAVVALRYDLVLLTSDNDFAPVPNLKQENWLIP